jgi:nucleoside-diphosphate-sugar epimerase
LDGTRNLLRWLAPAAMPAFRYLYTSSTGVYGQNDGSLVDESSPTSPTSDTAAILIETEQAILNAVRELKLHAMIVRASGIYGPDRAYLLRQFLSGDARIEGVGGRILNMIHRDDLIAAIIAALERGTAGDVFNATDDAPVAQSEFFAWLAAKTGRPMPATLEATTDMTRRRGLTNKRISNRKLRHELRVTLAFPTFREGYSAELARLGIG